ncbi:MAG: phosphate ABC transporter permease PstA [Alphaproteobacteria bacterium]|nr:phosphate ABC transporter permease PstA [Alphaproteobacteria bacterium]
MKKLTASRGQVLYLRRRLANFAFILLSLAAALFGLIWLGFILYALVKNGITALSPRLFSQDTAPPGSPGGLANAIYGSFVMSMLAVLAGAPIGLLGGTYLAEYSRTSRSAHALSFVVRFINDILLSAPSIVTGLFIYEFVVVPMGHFSGLAGALSLMVIVIPVVARTTENMLLLVPDGLREAAAALGAPRNFIVKTITWKAAKAGIITGILLAVARISGETAPLLFTALNNQFMSLNIARPAASLPVVIFQYALSPYQDWHDLAWAGAFLVTATVLTLSIIARILDKKRT